MPACVPEATQLPNFQPYETPPSGKALANFTYRFYRLTSRHGYSRAKLTSLVIVE